MLMRLLRLLHRELLVGLVEGKVEEAHFPKNVSFFRPDFGNTLWIAWINLFNQNCELERFECREVAYSTESASESFRALKLSKTKQLQPMVSNSWQQH